MLKRSIKGVLKKTPPGKRLAEQRRQYNSMKASYAALHAEKDQLAFEKNQLLQEQQSARTFLGKRYIKGSGIEIGAAHMPLPVSEGVNVTYVDMASTADLKKLWPEIAKLNIVKVGVVDDGEKLSKFIHASQDFVIANHFLEHCQDTIGALKTMHRVLKPGGVLFMAIPDKRITFDVDRPLTDYKHLLEEHKNPGKFQKQHTEEYVRLAEKVTKNVDKRVAEIIKSDYRIHYHVWTQLGIIELFAHAIKDFNLLFVFEAVMQNHNEVVVVLRKVEPLPY